MKPFATLGSEIGKVRDRVRASSQSLQEALAETIPPRVAHLGRDVREQRDKLLAKLGEQTFRLIAERKLAVPKVLQDSVERLAALLGVPLPPPPSTTEGATPTPALDEGEASDANVKVASKPKATARATRAKKPETPKPAQKKPAAKKSKSSSRVK